jgi:hypothetical protein
MTFFTPICGLGDSLVKFAGRQLDQVALCAPKQCALKYFSPFLSFGKL